MCEKVSIDLKLQNWKTHSIQVNLIYKSLDKIQVLHYEGNIHKSQRLAHGNTNIQNDNDVNILGEIRTTRV